MALSKGGVEAAQPRPTHSSPAKWTDEFFSLLDDLAGTAESGAGWRLLKMLDRDGDNVIDVVVVEMLDGTVWIISVANDRP